MKILEKHRKSKKQSRMLIKRTLGISSGPGVITSGLGAITSGLALNYERPGSNYERPGSNYERSKFPVVLILKVFVGFQSFFWFFYSFEWFSIYFNVFLMFFLIFHDLVSFLLINFRFMINYVVLRYIWRLYWDLWYICV